MMLSLCGEQQPLYIFSYNASDLFLTCSRGAELTVWKEEFPSEIPVFWEAVNPLCETGAVSTAAQQPLQRVLQIRRQGEWPGGPEALLLAFDLCKLQSDFTVASRYWQWLSRNKQYGASRLRRTISSVFITKLWIDN